MTIVEYVTTTTVFVEVRYGVTKAPHIVYTTTTTTLPRTLTRIERYFIETKTAEQTLTTYGLPALEGVEERSHILILACVAIISMAAICFLMLRKRPAVTVSERLCVRSPALLPLKPRIILLSFLTGSDSRGDRVEAHHV
jgi:hypothetical protein